MVTDPEGIVDPALLQRLISEKLWEIRKATTEHDVLSARRAERHMVMLLDQFAGYMITGEPGLAPRLGAVLEGGS
ncbi:hypothetical protein LWP59_26720 [Amycolatopsis acidiphila]|uniref:Uncharacterized protein n=1 Tax=Amycolatopsis acidiphila TaxID=715473 RepID=A0A558AIM3_9PSEU|nr:hypothetical protein [Amycolatopsis acidiphila]TVT24118.1 hypothetical protein FNH06_07940 [Amycolatopsis acidiphila]UIJ57721.1 hypothetical protein LWP59_26720 [Amycolatopsis acidiphila]GHG87286.1 hypothetical protein GCM10017788_60800 [Amycolatopsis acidiphila]